MLNRFIPFATTKTFRTPVRTTGRIQLIRSCYHLSYIAVKEYQVGDNMCVTARHSHIACFLWQALWRCSRARFRTQYTRWFSCDPDHRVPRGVWGRLVAPLSFPRPLREWKPGMLRERGKVYPTPPNKSTVEDLGSLSQIFVLLHQPGPRSWHLGVLGTPSLTVFLPGLRRWRTRTGR
jgi:hypothetical protein